MNNKVQPVKTEVKWDKTEELVSKTDFKGIITYVNQSFVDVSGYEEHELIGKPHNIIRHPDMPKVIFKIMWENILKGSDFHAIVKNMAKTGRYYWIITRFEIIKDDKGNVTAFLGRRKSISSEAAEKITELYTKLLNIEVACGLVASENYLMGFLDDNRTSFDDYIAELIAPNESVANNIPEIKRGFLARLFS